MMPILARRARSHRKIFEFVFEPGATPALILTEEGFSPDDQEAIMALVNDHQVELDSPLLDGDRVELLVAIQGGGTPSA